MMTDKIQHVPSTRTASRDDKSACLRGQRGGASCGDVHATGHGSASFTEGQSKEPGAQPKGAGRRTPAFWLEILT